MPELEIMLSWSKPLSHEAAGVLREWLPHVLPGVKPWMSSEDITKGTPWFSSISMQLARSAVCLICVTPENVGSTWLYFEAGAIAHAMQEALVCPLLIGVEPSELSGTPLGQYQCTVFEKDDLWLLVRSINSKSERPHHEDVLQGNFDSRWGSLQRKLARIATQTSEKDSPTHEQTDDLSPEAKLLVLEASHDAHGIVIAITSSSGYSVETNGKDLLQRHDAREQAAFRAAINDLVSRDLLEPRGSRGETFALTKLGFDLADSLQPSEAEPAQQPVALDDNDILCLLQDWFGTRSDDEKQRAIACSEVDRILNLPPGSAVRLLEAAAKKHNYVPDTKGANLITFKKILPMTSAPSVSNSGWDNPRNPYRRRR